MSRLYLFFPFVFFTLSILVFVNGDPCAYKESKDPITKMIRANMDKITSCPNQFYQRYLPFMLVYGDSRKAPSKGFFAEQNRNFNDQYRESSLATEFICGAAIIYFLTPHWRAAISSWVSWTSTYVIFLIFNHYMGSYRPQGLDCEPNTTYVRPNISQPAGFSGHTCRVVAFFIVSRRLFSRIPIPTIYKVPRLYALGVYGVYLICLAILWCHTICYYHSWADVLHGAIGGFVLGSFVIFINLVFSKILSILKMPNYDRIAELYNMVEKKIFVAPTKGHEIKEIYKDEDEEFLIYYYPPKTPKSAIVGIRIALMGYSKLENLLTDISKFKNEFSKYHLVNFMDTSKEYFWIELNVRNNNQFKELTAEKKRKLKQNLSSDATAITIFKKFLNNHNIPPKKAK